MRAAAYARVSSQGQKDRHTIENQLRELPAFIAAQGWTLVDTYIDDGRSARTGKLDAREGFARLVKDADAGRLDVVVVVDVDRLTRTDDPEERGRITGVFWRNNIQVVTPSGGTHDLRTMMGGLYVEMQARFAAEENRKRAARTLAGRRRAIANGRKPGSPTPFGLTYSRETGQWGVDEPKAALLREAYSRIVGGESCVQVADDFAGRGEPAPGRDGRWTRHAMWRLVRARYPMGEWSPDLKQRTVFRLPPIVNEATWQAAQARMAENGKRGLVKTKHVYLLEGLAVCGMCGAPIHIRSAGGPRNRVTQAAYMCRARKGAYLNEPRCAAEPVLVEELDARVWLAVAAELADPRTEAELRRRALARAGNRIDWASDVKRYRAHLERLERVEAAILGRYRRGLISDAAMDSEIAASAKERNAVTAQIATAELAGRDAGPSPIDTAADRVIALRELAATATPAERRMIVRTLLEPKSAVLHGDRLRFTLLPDEPATSAVPVLAPACETQREEDVEPLVIRVVV